MKASKAKKKRSLSAKQQESDQKLRDELKHFDLKKFDRVLEKALHRTRAAK
jgi:hypothetical protein